MHSSCMQTTHNHLIQGYYEDSDYFDHNDLNDCQISSDSFSGWNSNYGHHMNSRVIPEHFARSSSTKLGDHSWTDLSRNYGDYFSKA